MWTCTPSTRALQAVRRRHQNGGVACARNTYGRLTRDGFPDWAGFAELCRMDGRFEAFSKSLFSKAGAELNRETQVGCPRSTGAPAAASVPSLPGAPALTRPPSFLARTTRRTQGWTPA